MSLASVGILYINFGPLGQHQTYVFQFEESDSTWSYFRGLLKNVFVIATSGNIASYLITEVGTCSGFLNSCFRCEFESILFWNSVHSSWDQVLSVLFFHRGDSSRRKKALKKLSCVFRI